MPDPDDAELLRAASDSTTPRATLAELAYDHPSLRPAIAMNPSTYDGLLDWLRELNDTDVNAALGRRSSPSGSPAAEPPVAVTNAIGQPASALDITSLVLAILVPVIGLILAIVDLAGAKAAGRPRHVLPKAALAVSITLVVLEVASGVAIGVSVANAQRAVAYAPVCSAIANNPDLFSAKGPESLYSEMYAGSPSVGERATVWSADLGEITQWHGEVQGILQLVPGPNFGNSGGYSGGYLYSALSQEEALLDPATGPEGPVPNSPFLDGEKSWDAVGLNMQNVHDWATSNCQSG
ncbi:MAG TPA: hypothetical protein VHZ81_00755 [Galbitalea sp.]|nr:hypothetical protein [Galbitalea sp.]